MMASFSQAPGDMGLYISEEEMEEMLQSIQRRPGYPTLFGKFDGDPGRCFRPLKCQRCTLNKQIDMAEVKLVFV